MPAPHRQPACASLNLGELAPESRMESDRDRNCSSPAGFNLTARFLPRVGRKGDLDEQADSCMRAVAGGRFRYGSAECKPVEPLPGNLDASPGRYHRDDRITPSQAAGRKAGSDCPESEPDAGPCAGPGAIGNRRSQSCYERSDPDGDIVHVEQTAATPPQPELTARSTTDDPDGDIVHPQPLRPGELGEGTMIRVELLDRLSTTEQRAGRGLSQPRGQRRAAGRAGADSRRSGD